MGRPFQVKILESQEELEKALRHTTAASSKERLQILYWLKSGQVNSRQSLAELTGRDPATITRWLRKYQDGGCASLLEVKQRLQQPQGFQSYGEIQQWLQSELGLSIAYKTVYQLVHYRLDAKLKVPRPQSLKQHPEGLAHFKKNSL